VLTVEHITRLGDDQAPDWPTGRGWHVTVEGGPSMELQSRIAVHGEDETEQGCLGTAMRAVPAIAPVCSAAPGIRTFLDLSIIAGRECWRADQLRLGADQANDLRLAANRCGLPIVHIAKSLIHFQQSSQLSSERPTSLTVEIAYSPLGI
jgi:hypothetical protein